MTTSKRRARGERGRGATARDRAVSAANSRGQRLGLRHRAVVTISDRAALRVEQRLQDAARRAAGAQHEDVAGRASVDAEVLDQVVDEAGAVGVVGVPVLADALQRVAPRRRARARSLRSRASANASSLNGTVTLSPLPPSAAKRVDRRREPVQRREQPLVAHVLAGRRARTPRGSAATWSARSGLPMTA